MLKYMRSGAQSFVVKYIFMGLLLLGTVGVALFGLQNVFHPGVHSQTVATIGRDSISKMELDRLVDQSLRGKRITREEAYRAGVPLQELDREINSRVFLRAANDMGLIVDDGTVRRQIDQMLKPMMDKGMMEKQALDAILSTSGMSEGNLVESLKAEIAIERLSHALADGAWAPSQMVNDFMKYRYEWRRGDYIRLTSADAAVKEPSEDELKKLYNDTIKTHYMQPEYRSFSVLVLDAQSLTGEAKKPPVDAKTFYEQNKSKFMQPEQRTVSQISVADEALAQSLYNKAKTAKDFKKLAADAGKGVQYVSGTSTADTFLPDDLAADVFKAASGAVLPPKKTSFGRWVIARVEKIIPASALSFEASKPDIERMLKNSVSPQVNEAVIKRANEIDEMIGGGKSLQEIAKQFNMKVLDFDKVDATLKDPAGKQADLKGMPIANMVQVVKGIWPLEKGDKTPMMTAETGEYLVAELRDVQPAQAKPYDEVKSDVIAAWKEHETGTALDEKAQKIMERLRMGESLEKVAADYSKTIQKSPLLQRETKPDKSLDPGVALALFSIDKVGDATAVPGPGSITILRLAERKIEMPKEPKKEDMEAMQSMLSLALQTDILEQFRKSLMAKYEVRINEDAIKQMYEAKESDEQPE